MARQSRYLSFVVFAFFSLVTVGFAQELAATLSGNVRDQSGAAINGAAIRVRSNDSDWVREGTTNSVGSFTIPNLPAGRYSVTITNPGFQTYTVSDLTLYVAERRALDIQLRTGQVNERIVVTAEAATVQTTTAEESGTVTGTQVRELALNNRNYQQLVLLQPGVSSQLPDELGFGLQDNTAISINGARVTANNWTVDGADVNDSGDNEGSLNVPSIDAIQEFTLKRSSYDAEYGRNGGGQVLVATKAGGDSYHGDLYAFNRNNYYNATPPSATAVPVERYNDFGFTFGGRVIIPRLYNPSQNKTYFFVSEEWRKAKSPGVNSILVPTAQELSGEFTQPIPFAPAGCVSSSGGLNTISSSCYSQNAKAYLNAFMTPNPPNFQGDLLVTPYSALNNFRQDIIRVDQLVGTKIRLYARFMQDTVPQAQPFSLWGGSNYPGVETTTLATPGRNWVGNMTWTLSPRVVNEVEYADTWGAINSTLSGIANSPSFLSQLTTQNFAYLDPQHRAPNVGFASGTTGLGNGYAPYFERNIDHNIFDNLSLMYGKHELRTGFTTMWVTKHEINAAPGTTPSFFFDSGNNDPEFANFLLGQASAFTQANLAVTPNLHYVNLEAYFQDDWKITPTVTLNLGVRYSYFPSPADSANTLNNFDPLLFDAAKAALIDPATGLMLPGQVFSAATYANGIIFPKGAACVAAQTISSRVQCSPYGSTVNPNSKDNLAPRIGVAWDVFGHGKTAVRAGYGMFYDRSLNGMFEQNAFTNPPLVQTTTTFNNTNYSLNLFDTPLQGAAAGPPLGPIALTSSGDPRFKTPTYQNWNLSIEQKVLRDTALSVAYVGSRGTHLLGDIDLNQPTVAARVANTTADPNFIRPYAGYASIEARVPTFSSNYHSLQATLKRQFTNGLLVSIAYTWSKSLTDNPQDRNLFAYDTYNLRGSYGLSTLNTPQIFVASYVYDFPFFKNQSGLRGHMLGGWELSGITSVQSGQSLSVVQEVDPFQLAGYPFGLGMGRNGNYSILADLVGDPQGPHTHGTFFNTSAFADASGHFGTSRPGVVSGPGFQIWNLTLMKNLKFAERVNLQLRLETFNALNHTNPLAIGHDFDQPGTFGQVVAYHDPRRVQLGAKLYF